MIITYIHSTSPEDALRVQLRCRNFADAINRIGWHSANLLDLDSFLQNTPDAQRICAASDLLVVHRYLYGPVLQAVEYWKARDKKVVVDFDQAINLLTPDIPSHSFWMHGSPLEGIAQTRGMAQSQFESLPLEQFKWGLGLIDAAIVSSMRLVVDWSAFTNVYEIPDYLNIDQYPAFKQAHEKIWVGLANGARMTTIRNSGLLTALENICRRRPDVQVVLSDVADQAILDIHPSQLLLRSSCRLDEWADILLKLDIGLVPIFGDYDLRLGSINLLEFMISKTPWIASDQPSFREFSHFGRFVQNTSTAWEAAVVKVLDNLDVFQKRATGESFLFALSQDVNENIDKVLKLFTYILSQAK
jgi:glycosyltransferase involved in cell wall biosynthesis